MITLTMAPTTAELVAILDVSNRGDSSDTKKLRQDTIRALESIVSGYLTSQEVTCLPDDLPSSVDPNAPQVTQYDLVEERVARARVEAIKGFIDAVDEETGRLHRENVTLNTDNAYRRAFEYFARKVENQ